MNKVLFRQQQGFVMIITMLVLGIVVVVTAYSIRSATISEKISGHVDSAHHVKHLADSAAVALMHQDAEIHAAVSKALSISGTSEEISMPLEFPAGITAEGTGKMWAQQLPPPVNISPGIVNTYIVNIEVDVESNGVRTKSTTGYLRAGTASTGFK